MARNTANLSFYCRESKKNKDGKAPIELSLIINKERCYIQLPRKESPDEFKRAVESRKGNSIKEYLEQVRHRVGEIEIELLRDAQPLSASALRQYFRCGGYQMYTVGNLFDEYLAILKKRVGKDMTQKTFRKYELARDKFYRIVKPSEPVAAITNASILDYIATMNETLDYVTSNGYAQRVKTVVQFGIDNNRIKVNPFSGVHLRKGEKSVQFLSDEEVALIRDTNFHNESLNRVRDLFVFQCSCGLSYCDMFKLEPSDYQVTDAGQYFIHDTRNKTGIYYTAVILPEGVDILKRYNFQLPIIQNHKVNTYLKVIRDVCGINKPIFSHVARHTYATRCLNRGIRLEVVAKLLGHSTTKLTQHYAKLLQKNIIGEVKEAFDNVQQ